ncbi:hypothetical protein BKA65DRAFT_495931 [Rhexocercosporidium sp. MPI-PUGE-AT-0058]|nr:hypothetical protein BKA65DRAFT_495931 [Rhexocercosporidium sp. MPI-PUGE-AT-0058]
MGKGCFWYDVAPTILLFLMRIWECYGKNGISSVMATISERRCRLHHHDFVLRSLVYDRNDIKPISPEDYALCTSPCLSSIVVRFNPFGDSGAIDYTQEAVIDAISGLAPNLAHLCAISTQSSGQIDKYQTWELGRPAWKGFLPGTVQKNQQQTPESSFCDI